MRTALKSFAKRLVENSTSWLTRRHAVLMRRSAADERMLSVQAPYFRQPFDVLETLAARVAAGTLLVINTTNAGGLSRFIWHEQWEGQFDWTHHGVDQLYTRSLRDRLPDCGWDVASLSTHLVWDGSEGPTRATLRDFYAADARFRQLVRERNLGDLLWCVARRNGGEVLST